MHMAASCPVRTAKILAQVNAARSHAVGQRHTCHCGSGRCQGQARRHCGPARCARPETVPGPGSCQVRPPVPGSPPFVACRAALWCDFEGQWSWSRNSLRDEATKELPGDLCTACMCNSPRRRDRGCMSAPADEEAAQVMLAGNHDCDRLCGRAVNWTYESILLYCWLFEEELLAFRYSSDHVLREDWLGAASQT